MDRSETLELILDHYENPRNYGEMEDADISLQGGNPGCGDIITVYLKFKDNQLVNFTFTGKGCTISQAAASMLTELTTGYTKEQINALDFHVIEDMIGEELVKTRPKCATLALDTLRFATQQQ
jgi:nitrogen fixation protein NifU and related proteins